MNSDKSKGATKGSGRTRNYATVVYPESAPENWQQLLEDAKVPAFISPLHDKDINPTGEPKKAHYHVMVMYDSVKTKEQASMFFQSFGGVGCEVINSVRGYARYLTHEDNPEKAHYNRDDVISLSGSDYIHAIGTASDKQKAIGEMMDFIESNDLICFADLAMYARINRSDWFDALTNNSSYFIKEYIKSRTWKLHHVEEK